MRMRWVLTFKGTDNPDQVKAKARLVVLGFSDPDVGLLETQSPTMSRRSRQLMLQFSCHRGLQLLKANAKAAFYRACPHRAEEPSLDVQWKNFEQRWVSKSTSLSNS